MPAWVRTVPCLIPGCALRPACWGDVWCVHVCQVSQWSFSAPLCASQAVCAWRNVCHSGCCVQAIRAVRRLQDVEDTYKPNQPQHAEAHQSIEIHDPLDPTHMIETFDFAQMSEEIMNEAPHMRCCIHGVCV